MEKVDLSLRKSGLPMLIPEELSHYPVLLNEVKESFEGVSGWVVDCTVGRGGHFLKLLESHDSLIGFDVDMESVLHIKNELLKVVDWEVRLPLENFYFHLVNLKKNKEIYLVNKNFIYMKEVLDNLQINYIGGLLVDLGISMHQLKDSGRGFSFNKIKDPLDMRTDLVNPITASDLLNGLSVRELETLFRSLAEVTNAKVAAKSIVEYRKSKKIETVEDLLKALKALKKRPGQKLHPATKIFMALRIAVNNEHINLKNFLNDTLSFIMKGAVLDVIVFHSLEEKTVHNFVNTNGLVSRKLIPTKEEVEKNVSSRSGILYIIQKYYEN